MSEARAASEPGRGAAGLEPPPEAPLTDHFILAGAEESFLPFADYLWKACGESRATICLLHPTRPAALGEDGVGPAGLRWVAGSAADPRALAAAGAAAARALIFLAKDSRPIKSAQLTSGAAGFSAGSTPELVRSTRQAVLADADALLACYGVGEESEAELTHTIVELLYTTSVECVLVDGCVWTHFSELAGELGAGLMLACPFNHQP